MIIDDLPITDPASDILGRGEFVQNVSDFILNYATINSNCMVIGLEGDWGDGKNSVFNLLRNNIEGKGNIAKVGVFNSWLTLNENVLLLEFMQILLELLKDVHGVQDGDKYVKDLVDDCKNYTKKFIQFLNPSVSLAVKGAGIALKPEWNKIFSNTLTVQKERVKKRILQRLSDKRIVLFIDDIDRLNDEDILLVMQLVKNIADFPNVIYVLAYDRAVVERALDHHNKGNGGKFLDKIVQVPVTLPNVSDDILRVYFMDSLQNIFDVLGSDVDTQHIQVLYDKGVSLYINNIRQCKRVINAFYVKWLIVKDFCDAGDMLGIIALDLFEPDVYQYLLHNKHRFYGNLVESVGRYDKVNDEKTWSDIEELICCNASAVKHIIGSMFPRFGGKVDVPKDDYTIKRIAYEQNFYYYMTLKLAADDVIYDNVKKLFYEADEMNFIKTVQGWQHDGKIANVWDKLITVIINSNQDELQDRYQMLFHVISAVDGLKNTGLHHTAYNVCVTILHEMYDDEYGKLNFPSAKGKEIYNIFEDKKISLDILKILIDWIGSGYSLTPDDSMEVVEKYADEEVVKSCREIFLQRILQGFADRSIFKTAFLKTILHYLCLARGDSLKNELHNFQSMDDLMKVLSCALPKYSSKPSVKIAVNRWLWELIPSEKYSKWCMETVKNDGFTSMTRNAVIYLARAKGEDLFAQGILVEEAVIREYYGKLVNI
ncbi:P-loop NTPase fold protein [Anaerovibrio lipolyticus]|uniref:KAP family P-loop NTPase fold protein n=1 Tax=Anaerovibrio lipolyticus TaxID=82374 RepID=UPI0026EB15D6|nr:P-loop NTPase fold protein [Anaerovibrio lipolyticus]MBE6105731.1 hypothetical protein [Anaerovibrio lipolyticus]